MKKRYILRGFASKEDAQNRDKELLKTKDKKSTSKIHCIVQEEWGLEITEDDLHVLNENEKKRDRLEEIIHQPYMTPFIPMVYRYLDEQWVDKYFESGVFRLSSFKKFSKHTDEQRKDSSEGWNEIVGVNKEKEIFSAKTSHGHDAFILCTSLKLSEQLARDFEVNCCFVIEQPIEFMRAIANEIPDLKGVNFGPCLYKPDRKILRNTLNFSMEDFRSRDKPNVYDGTKLIKMMMHTGGGEVLFSKTNEYSHQLEYRFLWHSFLDELPEYIDICVPTTRKFCRKIKL